MVINNVDKGATIQSILRSKNILGQFGDRMSVCVGVNGAMKNNSSLNSFRVIEFFLAFDKIADEVAHEDLFITKRQVSVGQVIHEP